MGVAYPSVHYKVNFIKLAIVHKTKSWHMSSQWSNFYQKLWQVYIWVSNYVDRTTPNSTNLTKLVLDELFLIERKLESPPQEKINLRIFRIFSSSHAIFYELVF